MLDGFPTKFPPGERFSYCNGGYVVLALIAERASGVPYHELVRRHVCEPAGMHDTEFLRSDELPGRTALGYLEVDGVTRTNVFHLPVRGTGDGGVYTTVADVSSFWTALFAGRSCRRTGWPRWCARAATCRTCPDALRPRVLAPRVAATQCCWWAATPASRSRACTTRPAITYTVISNTTDGAWPVVRLLLTRLSP